MRPRFEACALSACMVILTALSAHTTIPTKTLIPVRHMGQSNVAVTANMIKSTMPSLSYLWKVEERSERMELHVIENQKEAFRQVQLALDSYNMLLEQILHTIVNIGGTSNVTG